MDIDISKLSPDTIITNEMLNPQKGERFLVIEHDGKCNKIVRENTEIETDAYRSYYNIKHNDKILIKAMVIYSNFSKHFCDDELIIDYEIIEVLKKGRS